MMSSLPSMLQKVMALLVLFGIANLFLLCLVIPMMSMTDMDSGNPCGMDHATELCPMTLNEQLSFWQKIILPLSSSASLLLVIIIFATVIFWGKDIRALAIAYRIKLHRYTTDLAPPLADYLQQQFSQGILHPKIY